MMPLISIIIPVFNTENYLPSCIESVINQTYSNLEIIIINDGSTDSSSQICQSYAQNDNRIIFIDKANEGVSLSRNLGLKHASGEWIYFLDSDDYLQPETFELLLHTAFKSNCDLIHFGFRTLSESKKVVDEFLYPEYKEFESLEHFFKSNKLKPNPAWLTFIRVNLLKESGIKFNVNMQHNEDLLFVYSLYCHANKIVALDRVLYNQVLSSNSASRKPLTIKVLNDRILFLSELCNYVRKRDLIKEFKDEINMLSKYIFVLALYYKDFDTHRQEVQKNIRYLFNTNKDIFNTSYSKLAKYNISIVIQLLKISHRVRKVKYIQ